MRSARIFALTAAVWSSSLGAGLAQVPSGPNEIKFPENYQQGALYATVDRADNKQYRELFAPQAAIEAAKRGEPLPDGTVLTLVQYRAELDADGNPRKDANGRFMKGALIAYAVMEKRAGWGAKIPEDIRNGDWMYQNFTADRQVNEKANLTNCFKCHKPLGEKVDFLFTYEQLRAPAK